MTLSVTMYEPDGDPHAHKATSPFIRLAEAFERGGVAYCYWKSARRIPEILEGRADLDLLVARKDRQEAIRILLRCKFKYAPDIPGRRDPAIMSFLSYDEATGAILHAHVHFRLAIGAPLFKRYRLPAEDAFLARSSVSSESGLRSLSPNDEALLLFVRAQVENDAFDPVQIKRKSAIARKLQMDFDSLRPEIQPDILGRAAREIFSDELADAIVRTAAAQDATGRRRSLALRIKSELAPYCNCGRAEAFVRGAARAAAFLFGAANRRFMDWPRPWGRSAPGGGLVIAFVGVDGSGKSTAIKNVRDWLGAEIDVTSIYFGTGDGRPSLIFLPFKALGALASRFIKNKPRGASHGRVSDRPPSLAYAILFTVFALGVALDKRHKLVMAQRAARRGFVVITDRYPQNEILTFNDGPLLHRLSSTPRWLTRFEEAVYTLAQKTPPDLVVKLLVGPEVVARREPDMNPAVIQARVKNLSELQFPGAKVVSIEARKPLPEVTRIIKREIWSII